VKNKQDGGFSLIEVVLAMVILALIVVPTCSSLVLSYRVNAKADAMLQAQLAVSSAVEQLMANGIDGQRANDAIANQRGYDIIIVTNPDDDGESDTTETQTENGPQEPKTKDECPDVSIIVQQGENPNYYKVVVADNEGLVEVVTHIRKAGGNG
jgi:prepilin-type N-terminal cleavage/methylation domain-containing protein